MFQFYKSENAQRIVELSFKCMATMKITFIKDEDIVQSMVLSTLMDQVKNMTGFEPADEIAINGKGDATVWFAIHKVGEKTELNEFAKLMGDAVSNVYGVDNVEVFGFKSLISDVNLKVTRKYD